MNGYFLSTFFSFSHRIMLGKVFYLAKYIFPEKGTTKMTVYCEN